MGNLHALWLDGGRRKRHVLALERRAPLGPAGLQAAEILVGAIAAIGEPEVRWLAGDHYGMALHLPEILALVRDHFLATGVRLGVKPAGGIRKSKQALHYLVMVKETLGDAWLTPELFRFGASSLLDDLLRQIIYHTTGRYPAFHDFAGA